MSKQVKKTIYRGLTVGKTYQFYNKEMSNPLREGVFMASFEEKNESRSVGLFRIYRDSFIMKDTETGESIKCDRDMIFANDSEYEQFFITGLRSLQERFCQHKKYTEDYIEKLNNRLAKTEGLVIISLVVAIIGLIIALF